jgi:alginate O-acetyltransferase complex protein AlgJ
MRGLKIAYVATFFALTALPVMQWSMSLIDISALDEKRRPAGPPDVLGKLLHGDGRLSTDINAWFDDRYGFRSLLVRLKNQLDYWLFDYSEKIFIGRDGWLYQPAYFLLAIEAERAGEAQARIVRARYLALARHLSERGIRLVIVSNPDKETIYPQYLPADAPIIPRDNSFARLRSFLKSRPEWLYLDGKDLLRQGCPGHELFLKYDLHMSFPGGLCFARELVARIAAAEGRPSSPWSHDLDFASTLSSEGGQASFMSLLRPLAPVKVEYPERFIDEKDPAAEGSFADAPPRPFEWIYRARPEYRHDKLPGLVLYGDSFLDYYRPAGMYLYFTDVSRVREDGRNLLETLQQLPDGTRYFVYQFLEPYGNFIIGRDLPGDPAPQALPIPSGNIPGRARAR